MKVLSLKALSCALLTTTLLLNTNLALADVAVSNGAAVAVEQVVYLNKSTVEDLVTLKGIGQKKAEAIVAYREQVGGFKSIEDLTKVKGIGVKVLTDNLGRLKI